MHVEELLTRLRIGKYLPSPKSHQGKKSEKKNDENCGALFIYKIISQSSIDRIILGAYLSVKDG